MNIFANSFTKRWETWTVGNNGVQAFECNVSTHFFLCCLMNRNRVESVWDLLGIHSVGLIEKFFWNEISNVIELLEHFLFVDNENFWDSQMFEKYSIRMGGNSYRVRENAHNHSSSRPNPIFPFLQLPFRDFSHFSVHVLISLIINWQFPMLL